MTPVKTLGVIIIVLLLIFGFTSIFTVQQGSAALVTRLGKLEKDTATNKVEIFEPGLHFKTPFITQVLPFNTRLQNFNDDIDRVVTAEQKDVKVDYYVKWRISNIPLYYKRTSGDIGVTDNLLRQKMRNILRAEFGKRTIQQVVAGERGQIMEVLKQKANKSAENLGIAVVDARLKTVDLPPKVSNAIYARMRTERERKATKHRADGKEQAEIIRANADAKSTVILAQATSNASRIRGEGDASAAKIYGNAYNQDPGFYAFYRSLAAYKDTFNNKSDILVLKPDMQFFKYFNSANGKQVSTKKKA